MLIFYEKFSVDWKLICPTLILIVSINVGSRKLQWPTVIGLFSVVITHQISS